MFAIVRISTKRFGCISSALDFDPYRENAHRAIMKSYADLGEKNSVLEHFTQMQRRFREELGVEPSPQTIALAKELID